MDIKQSVAVLLLAAGPAHAASYGAEDYTRSVATTAGTTITYLVHVPARDSADTLPLVVALHGCYGTAASTRDITDLNALADVQKAIAVYPEQSRASGGNPRGCWNFGVDAHMHRDSGEPKALADIVQAVKDAGHETGRTQTWVVDNQRVYIMGISSGAAMAVIAGVTYPDVYAAIGVHSGCPYGCSPTDSGNDNALTPNKVATEGQHINDEMNANGVTRVVPVVALVGTADTQAPPKNTDSVIRSWEIANSLVAGAAAIDDAPDATVVTPAVTSGGLTTKYEYTRYDYTDGTDVVEQKFVVKSLGHAWSGGTPDTALQDPFADAKGPPATELFYTFFLAHPEP